MYDAQQSGEIREKKIIEIKIVLVLLFNEGLSCFHNLSTILISKGACAVNLQRKLV